MNPIIVAALALVPTIGLLIVYIVMKRNGGVRVLPIALLAVPIICVGTASALYLAMYLDTNKVVDITTGWYRQSAFSGTGITKKVVPAKS